LLIVLLCAVAGLGTVLLLPGRREPSIRTIGGAIVLTAGLVGMAILIRATAVFSAGEVYFWIFAAVAIASSLRVISHPKPVYSALYFVLTVLASAGLFILLWAQFMAAALVLIYAGAILITYVFVIMLAQQAATGAAGDVGGAEYDTTSREPLAASAAGFLLMALVLIVIFDKGQAIAPAGGGPAAAQASTTVDLAAHLFQDQVLNLELAGLILALAMVGAIVVARRRVRSEAPLAAATPSGPGEDDPHTIPVEGTTNPRAKAWPEQ
jgi:NADH-quinone oxidoreductase subunit J